MCSENKGADQLRGHNAADLCFCFRICKNRFSHDAAHMILDNAMCDVHLLPHENRGGVVLIYIHNNRKRHVLYRKRHYFLSDNVTDNLKSRNGESTC